MDNRHYIKYYVSLDLNGQIIKDAKIEPVKSDTLPSLTINDAGRIYFNEDSLKLIMWNGYKWEDSGSIVTDQQSGDGYIEIDGNSINVYTLKLATKNTLGGVIVGDHLTIDSDGKLNGYYVENQDKSNIQVVTGSKYNLATNTSTLENTDVSDLELSGLDESQSVAKNYETIGKAFERTKSYVDSSISESVISLINFIGVTITPINNGSTTNPIAIDGRSVTAKDLDLVQYNDNEFMFFNNKWNKFGSDITLSVDTDRHILDITIK